MFKFSIIVPIYNAEKYLEQCITSIIVQEYRDYELILVNDCSTDASLKICEKYAKMYFNIKIINQDMNRGVSAARNVGIEASKGTYILFVDSDDFVVPTYLSTINRFIEEQNVELLTFGHYNYVDGGEQFIQKSLSDMNCSVSYKEKEAWNTLLLKTFFASSWNKVFSKKILFQYNIRFNETCVCYEDYLFNIDYCKHINTFFSIETPLYFYRQLNNVNHVNKRKWGTFLYISNKVAESTNEFIKIKETKENLSNIRRFTYQAYIVELQFVRYSQYDFEEKIREVLENRMFQESVVSITPRGRKLFLLSIFSKLRLFGLANIIIKSLL